MYEDGTVTQGNLPPNLSLRSFMLLITPTANSSLHSRSCPTTSSPLLFTSYLLGCKVVYHRLCVVIVTSDFDKVLFGFYQVRVISFRKILIRACLFIFIMGMECSLPFAWVEILFSIPYTSPLIVHIHIVCSLSLVHFHIAWKYPVFNTTCTFCTFICMYVFRTVTLMPTMCVFL